MTTRRTFVLDTSVLLSDPGALLRFGNSDVVLPLVVIGELEDKRDHPELGWFARQSLRILDDLRVTHGRLDAPVPVGEDGGTLHVELNHSDLSVLPAGFRNDSNDSRIMVVALNLRADGREVSLITKDVPLRVKAAAVGLDTDDYRLRDAKDAGWTGMAEVSLDDAELNDLYDAGEAFVPAAGELPPHTGLVLLSSRGSALGRVTADKQVRLVRGDREAFGLHGRSAEQRIALDLLLDPEVGIVSLGGRAGTGKSALALCAGLESVMERRAHKKVVVFRPLYAVGGQELGYLPGSENEKMSPWAQAVFDTLGALVSPAVIDEIDRARDDRGAAADPHPRPVAARLVRHRRRGAVAGARRAADRAVPAGLGLAGGAHPRRRPAGQPAGRPARRRHRRHRGAEGPPAVRARHADPFGALADRRPGHRDAGGPPALTPADRRGGTSALRVLFEVRRCCNTGNPRGTPAMRLSRGGARLGPGLARLAR